MVRILSLGAGVQSTTLLLMHLHGEIEPLDGAVFADTQWEPAEVYRHLDWLEQLVIGKVPIWRVTAGNIRQEALTKRGRFASMPLHLLNDDGGKGMLKRQCTNDYKIRPIRRRLRELGASRRNPVDLLLGISLDELLRMRDSNVLYVRNQYPLVQMRLTRADCLAWLERRGYPRPPKSACVGCPFRSDAEWRHIRETSPAEWRGAVAFDAAVRQLPRILGRVYLHASLQPLDQVDLSTPEDHGQLSLWGNECEGMCGV